MSLFLKTVILPNRFAKRLNLVHIEWSEYSFRSRRMPNGYWVTLAAVYLPANSVTLLGASACSPLDAYEFDRSDASNRALGRARQSALTHMIGQSVPHSMLGSYSAPMALLPEELLEDTGKMKSIYAQVADHAEYEMVKHDLNALRSTYRKYHFEMARKV